MVALFGTTLSKIGQKSDTYPQKTLILWIWSQIYREFRPWGSLKTQFKYPRRTNIERLDIKWMCSYRQFKTCFYLMSSVFKHNSPKPLSLLMALEKLSKHHTEMASPLHDRKPVTHMRTTKKKASRQRSETAQENCCNIRLKSTQRPNCPQNESKIA